MFVFICYISTLSTCQPNFPEILNFTREKPACMAYIMSPMKMAIQQRGKFAFRSVFLLRVFIRNSDFLFVLVWHCCRILWIIIITLSLYGTMRIFKGSYEAYTFNAISFVTETAYLDWNTTFPSVSICEITSTEVFWTE